MVSILLVISYFFLLYIDWLVDRRHCKQQWQAASLIVREKINAALQDMPENDQLAKLLEGTCKIVDRFFTPFCAKHVK
jgi:uncharacterized protein VirK/YbjX